MFKIAFIGQKGIPVSQGGVERHVEELSIRLARNGYEVLVYTRPHIIPKEYKEYEGVKLISLPSIHTKNLDAISHTFISTLHAVIKEKADIIHYQGVGPSLLSWLPKLLSRRVKVISTVHSADWEHQKWSLFAQWMLKLGCKFACKFADESIAVSRGLQKYCLASQKAEATYIPNGVSIYSNSRALTDKNSEFLQNKNNKAEQDAILKNFGLIPQKYLLIVTRLVRHKGIHYLIEAFKNIKDSSDKFADFKLVIVGSTAFTENYQQYLMRLTKNRKDIIFTGTQTGINLDVLYRNSYLYCQPSESEGLSISILEAMAYGKSVLVSDIDENLDLIHGNFESGAIGFDFKNKNVADLSSKLKILLSNPDIVKKVGKKAQEYVKLYYNWEEITERTERIYKNVIQIKDKVPSKFRLALAKYIFFL